jgi:glycosyltransferase involved in cell wall biosynthesis
MDAPRPSVSVIVPFAGPAADLDRLTAELQALARGPGDELIVVDNRLESDIPPRQLPGLTVLTANAIATPAFARNAGAKRARGEWLVFIDSDTIPSPGLLDAYFRPPPDPQTAILAGGIADVAPRPTLTARHDAARGRMSQGMTLRRAGTPYAQTANCALRRRAFEEMGGFEDLARAGEDADLCFRLLRAGWGIEERPAAQVEHMARQSFRPWLAQQLRHASGAAWLNRRWPGEFPSAGARFLANRTIHLGGQALRSAARGDIEDAGFGLLDLIRVWAFEFGRLLPNKPAGGRNRLLP